MKPNRSSFATRAVLVGLLAGSGVLAASAYAVSADRPSANPRCEAGQMHERGARHEARRTAHLAALKEKLQLTPQQEAAWKAFAQSRGPHQAEKRQAMREEFQKLNTPERLDRMQAGMDARRARMAERAVAIKALYAQLSPDQQRVFDAETLRHRGHGRHAQS